MIAPGGICFINHSVFTGGEWNLQRASHDHGVLIFINGSVHMTDLRFCASVTIERVDEFLSFGFIIVLVLAPKSNLINRKF